MSRHKQITGPVGQQAPDLLADEGTTTLVVTLMLTITLLLFAEVALSRNLPIAIDALQVCGVLAALTCSGLVLGRTATPPAVMLLIIGTLLVASVARSPLMLIPVLALGAFGASRVRWRSVFAALRLPAVWVGAAGACSLILAVVHLGDFQIMEKVAQGAAHQDSLFHASVSAMIKTYGVVSTGLHGLVPLSYHVLSHRLIAGLSVISGVGVLELYGILEVMVLCPLLLFAVAWATLQIAGARAALAPRLWLIACGALTVMKLLPLENWAVWDAYFVSDSYTLSLVLLLLALPPLLAPSVPLRAFTVSAAVVVASGWSKGSLGLLGVGLLWITAVAAPRRRLQLVAVTIAATAFLVYGLAAPAAGASSALTFNPFYTAQVYGVWGADIERTVTAFRQGSGAPLSVVARAAFALVLFLVVSFLFSWVVIARRFRLEGVRRAWRHREVQFSAAAILLGLVALQFRMAGGGYFVDQALFVALPIVVAAVSPFLDPIPRWSRAALGCAVLAGAVWLSLDGYYDRPLGPVFQKDKQFIDRLDNRGRGGPRDALLALRALRADEPVVFEAGPLFPKPVEGIWDCFNVPFTYPAVTEHAWVGLLDPAGPCTYAYYGYPPYFEGSARRLVPPVIPPGGRVVRVGGP